MVVKICFFQAQFQQYHLLSKSEWYRFYKQTATDNNVVFAYFSYSANSNTGGFGMVFFLCSTVYQQFEKAFSACGYFTDLKIIITITDYHVNIIPYFSCFFNSIQQNKAISLVFEKNNVIRVFGRFWVFLKICQSY